MHKISQLLIIPLRYYSAPTNSTVQRPSWEAVYLVKKFPFYGTQRLITMFTTARHYPLSRARSIQSTPSHPCLFLPSHPRLGLPSGLLLCLRFIHQNPLCTPPLPFHMTCPPDSCIRMIPASTIIFKPYDIPPSSWNRLFHIHCFPSVHYVCQ
jgi:hypothetical protein